MEIKLFSINKLSTKKLNNKNLLFTTFLHLMFSFHQDKENQNKLMLDAQFTRDQWIELTV